MHVPFLHLDILTATLKSLARCTWKVIYWNACEPSKSVHKSHLMSWNIYHQRVFSYLLNEFQFVFARIFNFRHSIQFRIWFIWKSLHQIRFILTHFIFIIVKFSVLKIFFFLFSSFFCHIFAPSVWVLFWLASPIELNT